MIKIEVRYGSGDLIQTISSQGHSTIDGNVSIPCAIVSSSLKTFGKVLSLKTGVNISGKSRGPGSLEFYIERVSDENDQWFRGVQDIFLSTIRDLVSHFPQEITLKEKKRKE